MSLKETQTRHKTFTYPKKKGFIVLESNRQHAQRIVVDIYFSVNLLMKRAALVFSTIQRAKGTHMVTNAASGSL